MPIFFVNSTHLLTRAQEKTFEDVFLVKIANEGATLRRICCRRKTICTNVFFIEINQLILAAMVFGAKFL